MKIFCPRLTFFSECTKCRHRSVRGSALAMIIFVTKLFSDSVPSLNAGTATLTVAVDKPGHAISPWLYGIFFEDINCSADGGLYAEMVRNRNFEESNTPNHWEALSP